MSMIDDGEYRLRGISSMEDAGKLLLSVKCLYCPDCAQVERESN